MPPHMIIAEDQPDVLQFLERAFQRIVPDLKISTAVNGADALTLFQQGGCDIIISDHSMPIMTGLELLVAVRRISPVPFIMLSADSMVANRALAAGLTEFVQKPLSLMTLRGIAQRWLPEG